MDDIETSTDPNRSGQNERHDGCQRIRAPGRDVMVGNAARISFFEPIRKHSDVMVPFESRSKFGRVTGMPAMTVVVVDHECNAQPAGPLCWQGTHCGYTARVECVSHWLETRRRGTKRPL